MKRRQSEKSDIYAFDFRLLRIIEKSGNDKNIGTDVESVQDSYNPGLEQ